MKLNPVYKRELKVSSRSIRFALIFMVFNGILAAAALFNMYSVVEQVKVTAEIQYSRFLELYILVSALEFILLMFIMPALTAGSISGERERRTLDLMLITTMKPHEIVTGKFLSAFTTMLLLILSGFPVQALVFVYGGITVADMAELLFCYAAAAFFSGAIGICCSSVMKRSTASTVCAYAALIFLAAGTYAVNSFMLRVSQNEINSYLSSFNMMTMKASSGICIYLLLLNPVVTFYTLLYEQAGRGSVLTALEQMFGTLPDNFILRHWTGISLLIQILLSVCLMAAAVSQISAGQGRGGRIDGKNRKKRNEKTGKK